MMLRLFRHHRCDLPHSLPLKYGETWTCRCGTKWIKVQELRHNHGIYYTYPTFMRA